MKITAISDLHGILPPVEQIGYTDYLLIAGDILPLNVQNDDYESYRWLELKFNSWCEELVSKFGGFNTKETKIIVVCGNHDFLFENITKDKTYRKVKWHKNVTYLENEFYNDNYVEIFGTPYSHKYGRWAWMPSEEAQNEMFDKVHFAHDGRLSIVLSHDAPFGVSDICQQETSWNTFQHIGNPSMNPMIERETPDLLIHGHLHSSNHEMEKLHMTSVVNVAYLNEDYKPFYKPFVFQF